MVDKNKVASLIPEDFSEGGGLPAVGTVCSMQTKFTMVTLTDKPVPVLSVTIKDTDTGEDYGEQYYTVGSPESWDVSDDGKFLIPVGGKALAKSSDVAQFLIALINAGFPEDRLGDGDISKVSGATALIGETPALNYKGQPRMRKSKKDGKEYEATLLVPIEIRDLPGANPNKKATGKKSSGKGGSKKTSGKSSPTKDNTEVKDKATEFIIEQLAEAGEDGVPKKGLANKAMQHFKEDADRSAIVLLCGSDEFLGGSDMWTYDSGIITME